MDTTEIKKLLLGTSLLASFAFVGFTPAYAQDNTADTAVELVEEEAEEETSTAEASSTATAQPVANSADAGDGEEVSDDDALVSLEDADAEIEGDAGGEADDDTFLEEEDDEGGDVTGIIGAPVSDEDDEN